MTWPPGSAKREAQVRRSFIASDGTEGKNPPLATLLRSGRGGAVRLKLFLSLLWIASGRGHSVSASAQQWAILIGLEDPSSKGARQIRSGLKWLSEHSLVANREVPGIGSEVTLLNDSGDGTPYSVPGKEMSASKKSSQGFDRKNIYVRLPPEFWTQSWIHILSGPAIAMLLVLLDVRGGSDPDDPLWFSGSVAATRYTLSEDTRAKGLSELIAYGAITSENRPVRSDQLASPRIRHVYRIRDDRLRENVLD